MKKFIPLEIELLLLESEDIITSSPGNKVPDWGTSTEAGDKEGSFDTWG